VGNQGTQLADVNYQPSQINNLSENDKECYSSMAQSMSQQQLASRGGMT